MIELSDIDISTVDHAAFRRRLPYFQSERFRQRMRRAFARPRGDLTRSPQAFRDAVGCSPAELALFMALVDTRQALDGKRPFTGFAGIHAGGRAITVDLKTAPDGTILDFRLNELGAVGADAKEIVQ